MVATFVLPLYPLEGQVLLPGEELELKTEGPPREGSGAPPRTPGDAVIASLVDGESVHEIAVTALIARSERGSVSLRGLKRCRLLALVEGDIPMVRAQRLAEPRNARERERQLGRLLLKRYSTLCQNLGRSFEVPARRDDLASLTWRITATLDLTPEQQQGFLNVPDALTRGKLLLVAVRDVERRERFLRPWARLRSGSPWN